MTIVALLLFGAGVIFISSAIECVPLVQTLQNIMAGHLTFIMGDCSTSGNVPPSNQGGTVPKDASGKCPPGYVPNPLARNPNAACIKATSTRIE